MATGARRSAVDSRQGGNMSALATLPNTHAASAATGGDAAESGEAIRVPLSLAYRYVGVLRRQHPGATPRQVLHVLEKRYLLAMSLGGTGTGLLSLGRTRTTSLLGISAAHLGGRAAVSAFHLLPVAAVYGVSPARAQDLLQRCPCGGVARHIAVQPLGVAAVYGVSPAHAPDPLQRCSFGEISGYIVDQQLGVGDSWWSTALAYLPASQVRFVDRLADRQLRRAAMRGGVSRSATALPAGIATTLGFSGGRILGHRVIRAAASFLGAPPNHFADTDPAPRRVR